MIDLILGTAGHIDHGKTSLVKALTGIDCDRLPEEKKRGITIDLGFAHLDLSGFRLGIVDVPGHERFIKNMLAGATGIDLALLVIAADDSVMPQTREHLEILQLLGVSHGVIALTKADLADDTAHKLAILDIRELVKGTFLESATIIPTSVATGVGVEELKQALKEVITWRAGLREHPEQEFFRLAIDRAFSVPGHGTIVTGTVLSGRLKIGDELAWFRSDGAEERVRVRGLNNHGQPVEEVSCGQRAAINLAGVSLEAVHRGQELATIGFLVPNTALTVKLQASAKIKHRLPVRVHLGTAEILGTVSLLDCDTVPPGGSAFAQLFLEEHAVAVWGQRFVLRDSSAERTVGGGIVLQPTAKKIRRRHLEQLERIEWLASDDPILRAAVAIWFAEYRGFPAKDLTREAGIPVSECESTVASLVATGVVVPIQNLLLHADRVRELEEKILAALNTLHEQHPLMTNHDRKGVIASLAYAAEETILLTIVEGMRKKKLLVGDIRRIARADFQPKLSINQRKLKDKIVEEHRKAGLQPPEPASFANQAGGNAGALKAVYEVACAEGWLVRIDSELYLHAEAMAEMMRKLKERLQGQAGATMAEIRDILGTTRKYSIPICEYLDRTGITRREGDLRVWNEESPPAVANGPSGISS